MSPENLPDEWSPTTNRLYDELTSKIAEYMQSVFRDNDDDQVGDYVNSWALVINYGNVNIGGMPGEYLVEAFPPKSPPHATKGLLKEGIDWVRDAQKEEDDDDDV